MSATQATRIQMLLTQHKEGWTRFHQLRDRNPKAAYEAAHAAIAADNELAANGFQIL